MGVIYATYSLGKLTITSSPGSSSHHCFHDSSCSAMARKMDMKARERDSS